MHRYSPLVIVIVDVELIGGTTPRTASYIFFHMRKVKVQAPIIAPILFAQRSSHVSAIFGANGIPKTIWKIDSASSLATPNQVARSSDREKNWNRLIETPESRVAKNVVKTIKNHPPRACWIRFANSSSGIDRTSMMTDMNIILMIAIWPISYRIGFVLLSKNIRIHQIKRK